MSVDAAYEAVFAHSGPWTEDDYFALPEVPARVELVDGALLVTPLSSVPHQRLVKELTQLFEITCPDQRWEPLPGANLWQDHIRAPDVVGRPGRARGAEGAGRGRSAAHRGPSPGNFRQDRIVRHTDYAEAGVPFYLRVDLHLGIDGLAASAFELVDGIYLEYATAIDGCCVWSARGRWKPTSARWPAAGFSAAPRQSCGG